jgi:hypothetical protein
LPQRNVKDYHEIDDRVHLNDMDFLRPTRCTERCAVHRKHLHVELQWPRPWPKQSAIHYRKQSALHHRGILGENGTHDTYDNASRDTHSVNKSSDALR